MTSRVVGSILLHCNLGKSNKEFFVEIVKTPTDSQPSLMSIHTQHGPVGKLRQGKDYGTHTWVSLNILLKAKLAKSYEIVAVNGKPFTSGNLLDAQRLMEHSNDWESVSTAQPVQKVKIREVPVTFDVGQFAPIW